MDSWIQLSDNSIVVKEKLALWFDCPRGEYEVVIEISSPDLIRVRFDNKEKLWAVETKAVKDTNYKLSGLTNGFPELLEDVCWFELIVGIECSITYWGDRVIYRRDYAKI